MSIINLAGVSWQYHEDDEPALRDIDLTIERGEFIGVIGGTGSGKSSLALVLRGIIPSFFEDGVFKGEVVVNGHDLARSDAQFSADEIGMVFQDAASQIFGTTVFQDASFGPCSLELPRAEVTRRVRTYLDLVRLRGKDERSPSALSGGEMQRLAIAGVLAMEPGILVLDEPVAELDPHGRRQVFDTLQEIRRSSDATVVLIEQDPDLIAHFADRVLLIEQGRIVRSGTPAEVFADAEGCLARGVFPPESALIGQRLAERYGVHFPTTPLSADQVVAALPDLVAPNRRPAYTAVPVEDTPVVLEAENVTFEYSPGTPVLDDVSVQVRAGEYVAVVGSNGAGKTTLTKHFNALRRPSSGVIRVQGRDIADTETAELAESIGYCFQNPDHQIFAPTVREEIEFGLKCQAVEEDERADRVQRIIEDFDLVALADSNPHSLGKGQRQKVALASILVLEPTILVIDEPTTGLDWAESGRILELIDSFHRRGTTVLAVTHDMRLVREHSTRTIAMSRGTVVFDGPTQDFFTHDELVRRADVEPTPLTTIAHAVADRAGLDPRTMPVTVDDLLTAIGEDLLAGAR